MYSDPAYTSGNTNNNQGLGSDSELRYNEHFLQQGHDRSVEENRAAPTFIYVSDGQSFVKPSYGMDEGPNNISLPSSSQWLTMAGPSVSVINPNSGYSDQFCQAGHIYHHIGMPQHQGDMYRSMIDMQMSHTHTPSSVQMLTTGQQQQQNIELYKHNESVEIDVEQTGQSYTVSTTSSQFGLSSDCDIQHVKTSVVEQAEIISVPKAELTSLCDLCGEPFSNNKQLENHRNTVHSEELNDQINICARRSLLCQGCGKFFAYKISLEAHAQIHIKDTEFICEFCGLCFFSSGLMHCHRRKHTGERPYKCKKCGACFVRKFLLRFHKYRFTTNKSICITKKTTCLKSKTISVFDFVRIAHNMKPVKLTPYGCGVCGSRFLSRRSLSIHQLSHIVQDPASQDFWWMKVPSSKSRGRKCTKLDVCGSETNQGNSNECVLDTGEKCSSQQPVSNQTTNTKAFTKSQSRASRLRFIKNVIKAQKNVTQEKEVFVIKKNKSSKVLEHDVISSRKGIHCFQCNLCSATYAWKASFVKHMRKVHGEGMIRRHGNSSEAKDPQLTLLELEKPFQCSVCDCRFALLRTLQIHLRTHPEDSLCEICNGPFTGKCSFHRHRKRYNTVPRDGCTNGSSDLNLKDGNGEKKKTKQGIRVKAFSKVKDTDIKGSSDSMARGSFDNIYGQRINLRSKKLKSEHKCESCGQIFLTLELLLKHVKIHDIEGSKFDSHQATVTAGETEASSKYRYKCEACSQRFSKMGLLRDHRRTHTGELPFTCSTCGETFARKCTLTSHINSHHNNVERPFKCGFCPSAFYRFSDWKVHEKKHNGMQTAGTFLGEARASQDNQKNTLTVKAQIDLDHEESNNIFSENFEVPKGLEYVTVVNFPCKLCGLKFAERDILQKHIDCEHKAVLGVKSGVPQISKQKATQQPAPLSSILNSKTKRTEMVSAGQQNVGVNETQDSKLFKCPMCPRSFSLWITLDIHKKAHSKI